MSLLALFFSLTHALPTYTSSYTDSQTAYAASNAGSFMGNGGIQLISLLAPNLANVDITTVYSTATNDIVGYLKSNFIGIGVLFAIGIIFAILTVLMGLFFCCCRYCNRCGGKKPKKGGYSACQRWTVSVLLIVVCGAVFFAGSFVFLFGKSMTNMFTKLAPTVDALADGVSIFANNTSDGASNVLQILNDGVTNLPSFVAGINFVSILRSQLDPTVNSMLGSLISLDGNIASIKSSINQTINATAIVESHVQNIQSITNGISASLVQLQTVSISGANYSVAGVPSLGNVNLPNISIDASTITSGLNSAPNLTDLANTLNNTYQSTLNSIPNTLNTTIKNFTGLSLFSSFNSSLSGALNTLTGPLTSTVGSVKDSVNSIAITIVQYDNYRAYAFYALIALIFMTYFFGLLAVVVQKGVVAEIVKPCSIILGFIVWILFVIFFAISLPLALISLNRDSWLSTSINAGAAPSVSLFGTNSSGNMIIQPSAIINGCMAGGSVLNITINSDDVTLPKLIGAANFFNDSATKTKEQAFLDFLNINSLLNSSNIPVTVSLPSLSGLSSIEGLNTSALNINMTVNLPFSINSTSSKLNGVSQNLTIQTFIPTFNAAFVTSNLTSFNNLALSLNNSFVAWTETYITNRFIINSNTFSPSEIASSSLGALNVSFYSAFALIRTNYTGHVAINNAQTNIANIQNSLNQLQSELDTITQLTNSLNSTLNGISVTISSMKQSSVSLNATAVSFPSVLSGAVVLLKGNLTSNVISYLAGMYDQVIQALNDGTTCSSLVTPIVNVVDFLTVDVAETFNGLYLCFLILGLSLFVGFILGVKAAKRFGRGIKVQPAKDKEKQKKK